MKEVYLNIEIEVAMQNACDCCEIHDRVLMVVS